LLPSSYPGRLASRNSTLQSRLLFSIPLCCRTLYIYVYVYIYTVYSLVCSIYRLTLKMETVLFSEKLLKFYQTKRRYVSDSSKLHRHRRGNLLDNLSQTVTVSSISVPTRRYRLHLYLIGLYAVK
jgi:hypothetical protein